MIKAQYQDKELVVEILSKSFDKNKSVNYIVKQDTKRKDRIKRLMEYSFEVCYSSGDVLLSENKRGCALVMFPDKRKTTLQSVLQDVRLIASCTGLANAKKAISRESKIKIIQPKEPLYYIWFIGVDPGEQNKGTGTKLMAEMIEQGRSLQRTVCLETSTQKNIPWYQKMGFTIYNELDLGYKLYFMKI